MNRLLTILGVLVLGASIAVAPVPLTITLNDPTRDVVIYPNVLFAAPMILLGVLLLLYGATAKTH